MLVRLMYASRANDNVGADELAAILKVSKARNPASGVTGVLCFCFSSGVFMQVLEGGRAQVNALYSRIARDARHRDARLLSYDEIGERNFAGWSMGQVNMDRLNARCCCATPSARRSTRMRSRARRRSPSSTNSSRRRR